MTFTHDRIGNTLLSDEVEHITRMSPATDETVLTLIYADAAKDVQFCTMRFSAPSERVLKHAPAWRTLCEDFLSGMGMSLLSLQASHEQNQPIDVPFVSQRRLHLAWDGVERRSGIDRRKGG